MTEPTIEELENRIAMEILLIELERLKIALEGLRNALADK